MALYLGSDGKRKVNLGGAVLKFVVRVVSKMSANIILVIHKIAHISTAPATILSAINKRTQTKKETTIQAYDAKVTSVTSELQTDSNVNIVNSNSIENRIGINNIRELKIIKSFNAIYRLLCQLNSNRKQIMYRISNTIACSSVSSKSDTPIQHGINDMAKGISCNTEDVDGGINKMATDILIDISVANNTTDGIASVTENQTHSAGLVFWIYPSQNGGILDIRQAHTISSANGTMEVL